MLQDTIHTNRYQHFEDLQISARDFYYHLRDIVNSYKFPGVECSPVELSEAGIFSSRRDYLRISKQRYNFYVCAAPFGKSFFVSWWLQEDEHTTAKVALKIPLVGQALAKRLESKTYYELDTELMFTTSINSLMLHVIDQIKLDKGFKRHTRPQIA